MGSSFKTNLKANLKTYSSEAKSFIDSETGYEIRQLTNSPSPSYHLYFTLSGWHQNNERLLFVSERNHGTNLFSMELESGEFNQLTDYSGEDKAKCFHDSAKNPVEEVFYYRENKQIIRLNLETLERDLLATAPDDFDFIMINCLADGKHLCAGLIESGIREKKGFAELQAYHPLCKIALIDTQSGKLEIIHEEKNWINHINANPVNPNLFTFCHEGPWTEVDNRIWGYDLSTGKPWKIRECNAEAKECVGHEYWMQDGEHIGYHGHVLNENRELHSVFGSIRYDNTDRLEFAATPKSKHTFGNSPDLIVGDGNDESPALYLWKRNSIGHGPAYMPVQKIRQHNGNWNEQKTHVHPRFSPDGNQILFTSNADGLGQIFLIKL